MPPVQKIVCFANFVKNVRNHFLRFCGFADWFVRFEMSRNEPKTVRACSAQWPTASHFEGSPWVHISTTFRNDCSESQWHLLWQSGLGDLSSHPGPAPGFNRAFQNKENKMIKLVYSKEGRKLVVITFDWHLSSITSLVPHLFLIHPIILS